jgi:hypothetical protein
MDRQKIAIVAGQVRAIVSGFIGIAFFSLGTSYFQERLVYRVPRILAPVFNIFGYTGLAVGLLILGAGLIYYGFTIWNGVSAKKSLYWILAVSGLIIGILLANIDFDSHRKGDIKQEIEKDREAKIDEIRHMDAPEFNNAEVENHLAEFDIIYKRLEQSIQNQDEAALADCENQYAAWSEKGVPIIRKLDNKDKTELARYWAKLAIRWNDALVSKK